MSKIETPAFLFDIDKLIERVNFIKKALGKIKLCYAIKANPFLMEYLVDEVDYFEVCSPGEYRICKRMNIPREKIVLSGVFKEEEDISKIVDECKDKTIYTIESKNQLLLLDKIARKNDIVLNVYIRLTSGNQFGVDEKDALEILKNKENYSLSIKGLQYYSGTQKKTEQINNEIEYLTNFMKNLDFKFDCFEYGPGLKINYFKNEQPIDENIQLEDLVLNLSKVNNNKIVLEMGRYIAAMCGEYHTKVVDIKKNKDINYCIVDGGINHLNYYGQTMAMKAPYIYHEDKNKGIENWTICGSLCTVADVLIKNYPIDGLEIGDELVFDRVGAYSITEGIYLFLSRDMPKVYVKKDGKIKLVRNTIRTDLLNSKGEN